MTEQEKIQDYMRLLNTPFEKLVRLRFLQPDGSTAFTVDGNPYNRDNRAFITDGTISTNLQNGQRRSATVTFAGLTDKFDYDVNHLWFGTEIAIDEGLRLSDGTAYYIQQGVFIIDSPTESIKPNGRVLTYPLVDKWAMLDGRLGGNLESTYEVPVGTNIFTPIVALLSEDRGNGYPVDSATPIFTEYYNGKTQRLPDGTVAYMTNTAHTLTISGEGGTKAAVVLGLASMVNAWVGYDRTGALRLDPSQDDILDTTKPILWRFDMENDRTLLGMDYTSKNTEVYNDYIVVGEQLDNYIMPNGRAQNLDPTSDTNVNIIGRKTFRETKAGYATDTMCQDYAAWKLKRSTALQKAVTISCSQLFHIEENSLVTIRRADKPGSPVERHLIMGFSRPLVGTGQMQINAVSVNDFPIATLTTWPD